MSLQGALMHVLMTVDAVGGVWTYALELVRALPDVRFSFAQMGPRPGEAQRKEVAALPSVELFESDWKLEWQPEPWEDVDRAGQWLLELEDELKPDVVHLNGYSHGVLPFRGPKVVVAHSCVGSWWSAVKEEPAPCEWEEYTRRVQDGLNLANAVVAPTCAFGREIERLYPVPRRVETVWNGACEVRRASATREFWVLAAGRAWDEAKNFTVLEEAASRLPLLLAGEAGSFQTNHLRLQGHLKHEQLQQLLQRTPIFAHPALYEPFGLGVLEAAQAGCALVLSDIPTLRELWDGAALFCAPRDQKEWARVLVELWQDDERVGQLAKLARRRAQQYSREAFGQGYRTLYERLTSNR